MFQGPKQYLKGLKLDGLLDLTGGKLELNVNVVTTQTKTFVAADCGKIWLASYAGASTFTLPANTSAKAGRILIVGQTVDQDLTIAAAAADTLITDGDLQADSVAFSTTSHKIGSLAIFIGIGGSWLAVSLGGTTMTVNT
jgi:hypothetical protein